MIKTYKGKIASNDVVQLRLSTSDGLTGYKIKQFKLIFSNPGAANTESTVKIFSVPKDASATPSEVTSTINFDDPTLLAAAFMSGSTGVNYPEDLTVIVDNAIINQDLYLTHVEQVGNDDINYYVELEQIKLDLNEATVATLKDMRGRE